LQGDRIRNQKEINAKEWASALSIEELRHILQGNLIKNKTLVVIVWLLLVLVQVTVEWELPHLFWFCSFC
jgi:hypothetical protein